MANAMRIRFRIAGLAKVIALCPIYEKNVDDYVIYDIIVIGIHYREYYERAKHIAYDYERQVNENGQKKDYCFRFMYGVAIGIAVTGFC